MNVSDSVNDLNYSTDPRRRGFQKAPSAASTFLDQIEYTTRIACSLTESFDKSQSFVVLNKADV